MEMEVTNLMMHKKGELVEKLLKAYSTADENSYPHFKYR